MVKERISLKEKKHRARRISIKEGMFASAKTSFGYNYLAPFAIAINASNSLVAMLGSISGLLGPLGQIFGSRFIGKYPRKKIVLKSVLLEILIWIPIILLAFLFYKGIWVDSLPFLFLFFFSIYILLMNFSAPSWFSWMGDIVDEKFRGRWFAKRTLIIGFVSVIITITASVFLDYFRIKGWTMFGFMVLFSLAALSRLESWRDFRKQYEPKLKLKKGSYFSFWDFLIDAPKNNFGRFSIYVGFLFFTIYMSLPLLVVYLLRNLEFSYTLYMVIIFAGTILAGLTIAWWGSFADKYGNYKILAITSIMIPTIPILWVLHPSPIYLILVPSIISGLSWTGFNLAARNLIYDNVSAPKRGLAVSYFRMLQGVGIFLGAGLGAILIKVITTTFIEPIKIIFIASGILGMLVVFFGLLKIREVRKTEKLGGRDLKNLIFKEGKSSLSEEVHEIMSIKDYLETK
jgi:MFS family permease